MLAENFRTMAKYNQWMNGRLLDCAEQLDPSLLSKNMDAFFSSILGTLNHIMVGDLVWLHRMALHPQQFASLDYIRRHEKPAALDQQLHSDLGALRTNRVAIDKALIDFTNELNDDLLASELRYSDMKGNAHANTLGILLQHVFNHQTHHRGQVSTLFNQCGIDIGVTDLLYLVRNS